MGRMTETEACRYAGIGTRNPTKQQRKRCIVVARHLAKTGWVLVTGACTGTDQIFVEAALRNGGKVELVLPWASYESVWVKKIQKKYGNRVKITVVDKDDKEATDSVFEFHPAPQRLKRGTVLLHARNYRILFPDGKKVSFVAAAPSPEGGGTAQGLRIARGFEIPAIRLDKLTAKKALERLEKILLKSAGLK